MVNLTNSSFATVIFWINDSKIVRFEVNLLSLNNLLDQVFSLPKSNTFYTKITIEIDGIVKQIYPQ
jgi:hypothetical protein